VEVLFSHERLEAYRVAMELRALAHALERRLARGDLREQLTTATLRSPGSRRSSGPRRAAPCCPGRCGCSPA